jgi:MerR family transcriptional regulator, Zn(II)-responsive regulator of zntA
MKMHNGSLTVEALSRMSGLPAHTIRYYTRRGLLHPMRDPANSYRLYSETDVSHLRLIRKAKSIGFSLGDIKKVVEAVHFEPSPRALVQSIIRRRAAENRRRLSELAALQSRMERAVEVWSQLPDGDSNIRTVRDLIEVAAV